MSSLKKDKGFFENGGITERGLLAYINREMTAEEVKEAEQLLNEDPFSREALEGLQATTTKMLIATSLTSLNKKVRTRAGMADKKPLQIHWTNYAWAAALLGLLIGVGIVMINFVGKPTDDLAQNKQETPAEATQQPIVTEQQPSNNGVVLTDSSVAQAPGFTSITTTTTDTSNFRTREPVAPIPFPATANKNLETKNTGNDLTVTNSGIYKTENDLIKGKAASGLEAERKFMPDTFTSTMGKRKDERAENNVYGYKAEQTTEKVVRGSIMEKDDVEKVTLVTLDGAMKNFNSGNYKKAAEEFDAILQQQPNNADALYFGGISDYINGNDRKSEKNFDKLLKEGSKFVEGSKWYKANLLLRKGKKAEAAKLLDELSESNGSYREKAIKKKAEIKF